MLGVQAGTSGPSVGSSNPGTGQPRRICAVLHRHVFGVGPEVHEDANEHQKRGIEQAIEHEVYGNELAQPRRMASRVRSARPPSSKSGRSFAPTPVAV